MAKTDSYERAAEHFEAQNGHLVDMLLEARGLPRDERTIHGVLAEVQERMDLDDARTERELAAVK